MIAERATSPMRESAAPLPRRRRLRLRLTRARLVGAIAILFAGVVVVNAVVFQEGKHPAPLFRSTRSPDGFPLPPLRPEAAAATRQAAFAPVPLGAGRPAAMDRQAQDRAKPPGPATASGTEASDTLVAEIQRELAKRGFFKGESDGKAGPKTSQAIRDFQFAERLPVDGRASEEVLRVIQSSKVAMKDELLDLLKKTAEVDRPNRTVLDIQRALNKAGYGPLSEDGEFGPSTRAALTRFETDRKLPPKGEPKGPVLQVLASVSGVPIAR